METIAGRGQSGCLLKEDPLAVLYASGEILLNQAFSLPPFWNGHESLPLSQLADDETLL